MINVDIIAWEKLSSILVANMEIIYWTVCLSSRREVVLASYKFYFIRVHDNLEQDPSNNKSIVVILF